MTVEDSVGLLLRFPPGAHGDFHEHLGYELMLVLDGTLEHSDGDTFERGDLVVEAPGTRHQMSSSTGCTVLAIRTRPAANRVPFPGEIAPGRPTALPTSRCLIASVGPRAHHGPIRRIAISRPPMHGDSVVRAHAARRSHG